MLREEKMLQIGGIFRTGINKQIFMRNGWKIWTLVCAVEKNRNINKQTKNLMFK